MTFYPCVLVNVVSWIFPEFKFQWLVDETKRNLPLELDFVCEGNNAERVARMLKQFSFLKVPKIVWDLTTERVLTMEFCDGGQVNDKDYIKKHDICITEVTKNLSKMYSEMIFVQGYVHSDPHPGNVLVKKTPQGTQIVLLDHGLYATLTSYFRVNYSKLWLSLIASDVEKIQKYATRLGVGDLYQLLSCMITARSWKSISSGISKQVTAEENAEIQQMAALYLPQITDVLSRVSREMLLILKANDLLRGIEYSHGIQASTGYFLTMARHCVRAVYEWRHHQCGSRWCRVRVACAKHWTLLRIDIYELLLRWSDSALIVWLTSRFAVA
ncbi:PREDICTED: uncharacterized aarF domain-containing protein kinase 1-like [Priapulus caudatus]|uniref:Uncharacterized aarF domain-containing protein kinase 1-like n=1 Tax=Priapulus caudatus TaxID=37621 RepID=A0ABM1EBV6_PRICU|nr:PREDICTED: uncharacterized aarF domain-containing protein kinase 1-like [Priapulus caudatus]